MKTLYGLYDSASTASNISLESYIGRNNSSNIITLLDFINNNNLNHKDISESVSSDTDYYNIITVNFNDLSGSDTSTIEEIKSRLNIDFFYNVSFEYDAFGFISSMNIAQM